MKITRYNKDSGSFSNKNIIDGYLFSIPSNVIEINKDEAVSYFKNNFSDSTSLKNNIVLSTFLNQHEEERYFLISDSDSYSQINYTPNVIQNKTSSDIPYITFLAAITYYHSLKLTPEFDNHIEIDYFSTALPIWLLRREITFKVAQTKMAKRFEGEHKFSIYTPGYKKNFTVLVKRSVCLKEGEISKLALKKDFLLQNLSSASEYDECETVLIDIGGTSINAIMLDKGLTTMNNRNAFRCIENLSYLNHLNKLREENFPRVFEYLREFDQFIFENHKNQKFELKNEYTGMSTDYSDQIQASLKEYVNILLDTLNYTFPPPVNKMRKYIYTGGASAVLKQTINNVINEKIGQERTERYHKFPENSRYLNLFGLEIRSLGALRKSYI
ncbi:MULTISPECIES: membrane protein [Priestia]|uniref:Alp7A family actin-like protein n=1 Tax=Priestia TaxID=2800373 RepID=UPI0005EC5339|nr:MULTISPECIES: membrane protein [Priestia]KJL02748.1 membrane protein [Priestia aryabhattai B8W22]MBX4163274.1 hypothetical protein [Priestia megaterium]MED3893405.1 hypothetical protein [Priestia aryabhattai]